VSEAEAVAVHLQDMDVVGQPVEQGAGQALGAEHACPFVEGRLLVTMVEPRSNLRRNTSNSSSAQRRHGPLYDRLVGR